MRYSLGTHRVLTASVGHSHSWPQKPAQAAEWTAGKRYGHSRTDARTPTRLAHRQAQCALALMPSGVVGNNATLVVVLAATSASLLVVIIVFIVRNRRAARATDPAPGLRTPLNGE